MPYFLITIDTEGDNIWASPRNIETSNARFLPRFQTLCEKYGFKPTYLTNYEMARDPYFIEFAADVIKRGAGEVGMHLHAWNTPPLTPLTADDYACRPYLIEYPESIMRAKVAHMTELLETTFNIKIISHRAGRWSMDARYARILLEYGYRIDCSVTPHVSWHHHKGDPGQSGGTDFSDYPEEAYFVDLDNLKCQGNSGLLELPMTIMNNSLPITNNLREKFRDGTVLRKVMDRLIPPSISWLRPNGRNVEELNDVVRKAVLTGRDYIEFMLHSSEFMPGGSPTFKDENDIEKLYEDLDTLFGEIKKNFKGRTLREYGEMLIRKDYPEKDFGKNVINELLSGSSV